MTAYPAPMLRIIRRQSQLLALKQAARHGCTAAKGIAIGVSLYLIFCLVLGQ